MNRVLPLVKALQDVADVVADQVDLGAVLLVDEAGVDAQRLRELDEEELVGLLVENSDEPYAQCIASEIMRTFARGETIDTTRQLYDAIARALSFLPKSEQKDMVKKSCQRCFQALRIDVNSEFEVLYAFLEKLPTVPFVRAEEQRF